MKTNAVFSAGIGTMARSRFAGLAVVFSTMMAGCRGCSDVASLDDEVKVQAKRSETREERRERRASSRADLKKLRALTLRAPSAEESDHALSSAVEKARSLVEQNDKELAREAIAGLETWLADHPEDLDAVYWSGRARMVTLELDQAIALFESATKIDDTYVLPYRWMVYALGQRQRYSEALAIASLAVALEPADPDVYVDRALCGLRSSSLDTMVADLEKACSLGDTDGCEVVSAARMVMERRRGAKGKRAEKGRSGERRGQKMGKGKGKRGGKPGMGLVGESRPGKGKGRGKGRNAAKRKAQQDAEGTSSTAE